jgi:predicted transcriptional regulator YdeE
VHEFKLAKFGPCRVIGMNYIGDAPQDEIGLLWRRFCDRLVEIKRTDHSAGFGICRCLPRRDAPIVAEYIVGVDAVDTWPLPGGMIETGIPRSDYAVFEVPEVARVRDVSLRAQMDIDASAKWARFCGPRGCECHSHPAFEYYPPGWERGSFSIYIPVVAR